MNDSDGPAALGPNPQIARAPPPRKKSDLPIPSLEADQTPKSRTATSPAPDPLPGTGTYRHLTPPRRATEQPATMYTAAPPDRRPGCARIAVWGASTPAKRKSRPPLQPLSGQRCPSTMQATSRTRHVLMIAHGSWPATDRPDHLWPKNTRSIRTVHPRSAGSRMPQPRPSDHSQPPRAAGRAKPSPALNLGLSFAELRAAGPS